jgi:homoserine O-acetyltransferase/O-succinyltransferase
MIHASTSRLRLALWNRFHFTKISVLRYASSTTVAPVFMTPCSASSNDVKSICDIGGLGAGLPGAMGSGIGTDVEMIAANHRYTSMAPPSFPSPTSRASLLQRLPVLRTSPAHSQSRYDNVTADSPVRSPVLSVAHMSTTPASLVSGATAESAMKDEYGTMDSQGDTFECSDYVLESGAKFRCQLRYKTYGTLNEQRDNCVVVCHALTGNASLHAWWGDLLGDGRAFDTSKYFVVCCNILGSCYGSTSPASTNPDTGEPYGIKFPDVSVQDTVRLQLRLLKEKLQIASVKAVIGGSFGGMQAVEFAVQAGSSDSEFATSFSEPFVRSVIPIACGAQHTAWQIAISEVQRQAIYKDPSWAVDPFSATRGLEVARQLGMISYRTPKGYCDKFGRSMQKGTDPASPPYGASADWKVKSYLEYQGSKFLTRFDPVTYVKLTEQMDSHDVTRGRSASLESVLGRVEIPALVLGIDSDILYPLHEQEELAKYLPNSTLKVIHSIDGHDGFLLEQDQVGKHITDFLSIHE